MRLPSDIAIGHLFEQLRALNSKPADKVLAALDSKLVDSLHRRTLTAVQRDRTGSVVPDGYPTSGGGAMSSGISTSSTERAAVALADSDIVRDRHHDLTELVVQAAENAVIQLNTLMAGLASLDDLTNTNGPAPRTCQHCTGKRGKGNDRPVAHTGTVGDRLERSIGLCEDCWAFVRQSAKPNTREGRLPTELQIRDHEERGRWRIKVA